MGPENTMTRDELHVRLAALALDGAAGPGTLVDLGAGWGRTLIEVARSAPRWRLTALDLDGDRLARLATHLPQVSTLRHDLTEPLPLPDASVDVVLSHNTLECLLDPAALLAGIARVLRPGGRLVLGHTDFETIAVATADRDLARRVLHTYARLPVPYEHMTGADGQMGRRLAGLVRRSPLRLTSVEAHTLVLTSLDEAMAHRLDEVTRAVHRAAAAGRGDVGLDELDAWTADLRAAQTGGDFLFAETAFLVTARRDDRP